MIKNIFFDLDECLIHSQVNRHPEQNCFKFNLDEDVNDYYTIVRPRADFIINYAREKVSFANVFILTTSIKAYASEINRLAGFRFSEENILSRETLKKHSYPTAYSGSATIPLKDIAHKSNILIDNLCWSNNTSKMDLIGIAKDRHLQVKDYYGVNRPNDLFEKTVIEFINEKYNNNERRK